MRFDERFDGRPYDMPYELNLMLCPNCHQRCSARANYCPHCTHPISAADRDQWFQGVFQMLYRVGRIPAVLLVLLFAYMNTHDTQPPSDTLSLVLGFAIPLWMADCLNYILDVRWLLTAVPIWTLLIVWELHHQSVGNRIMEDGFRPIAFGSALVAWAILRVVMGRKK